MSGPEYNGTIQVMTLQTPQSCMPPPNIVCMLYHRANIEAKSTLTNSFYFQE